jgi:hypothetical protein
MTTIERLQAWFASQCNGDWEHDIGIAITTIDNPGWAIDVTLRDTSLHGRPFTAIKAERTEDDWLHASVAESTFKCRCGPKNLDEALALFCDWARV